MRKIELTKGYETIVDDDDFEWLSKFRWQVNLAYTARAVRHSGGKSGSKTIYMHREIMRAREHEKVDHINNDSLDNRKSNLRLATSQENSFNQQLRKKSRHGYKGLSFRPDNPTKPWRAAITYNAKTIHIGYYPTKEQAAEAYNAAADKYFGRFARKNEIG